MLDLINQEHSGRCVLKHPNRADFEFMKAHGRRDIHAQGVNDLCVKASKQRNGRELRRDDRSPTAPLFAVFQMVALELLKKHVLPGTADSVDQRAGHANAGRSGNEFLQAPKPGVAYWVTNPPVTSETHGEDGGWKVFSLISISGAVVLTILLLRTE